MKTNKYDKSTRESIGLPNNLTVSAKKTKSWQIFLMLATWGSLVYANSFDCSFHLDDINNIIENRSIRSLKEIGTLWAQNHNRFVAMLTFAVNYRFGGLNVWGYHFVNILIHIFNAFIVYRLTDTIFSTPTLKNLPLAKKSSKIALFTAFIFVSHPLATQSVTYIVQRMASLSTLFYLFSFLYYLKGRLDNGVGNRRHLSFFASVVSAILAFFTKENTYTLFLTFIMAEFFLLREGSVVNIKNVRWLIISAVGISILSMYLFSNYSLSVFQPIPPDNANDFHTITPLNYLFTQFFVVLKYFQLFVLPIGQNVDYDISISNSFLDTRTFLCFVTLSAVIGLAVYLYKNQRLISFSLFWIFITLSIESTIIPISDVIFEHRTYLPSFGFSLAFCSIFFSIDDYFKKSYASNILIFTVILFSLLSINRNTVWKNDYTLWNDVVFKSPRKVRPYNYRGTALFQEGKWKEAIIDFSKAISIQPEFSILYFNRGAAYKMGKEWNLALADFKKMLEFEPAHVEACLSMVEIYGTTKDWGMIEQVTSSWLKTNKPEPRILYKHGVASYYLNDIKRALVDFQEVINLDPNFEDSYNMLAGVYGSQRDWDAALNYYNKLIQLNPRYEDAYYNRGVIHFNMGKMNEALDDYNKALDVNPKNTNARNNREVVLQYFK